MRRILRTYGVECEVFAIPNSLTVSFEATNGKPLTIMKRIGDHGNDLEALEQLNALSRCICREKPTVEDGFVSVVRVSAQAKYPARAMFVAAMNPCPCGNYGSSTQPCRCTQKEIARYLGRISGPLLDRIDMQLEVTAVPCAPDHRERAGRALRGDIHARVQAARRAAAGAIRGRGRQQQRGAFRAPARTRSARWTTPAAS